MFRGSNLRFVLMVIFVSLIVRIAAVGLMRGWQHGPYLRQGIDAVEYDELGYRLATTFSYSYPGGNLTSFRAPGFPCFLALIYSVFGRNYFLARMALCMLGTLSVVITYLLAKEVLEESRARLACMLQMIYPPHVLFATLFESENLFIPLLAGSVWICLRQYRRPSFASSSGAGFLWGCAALTRPFAVLVLPVFAVVLGWTQLRARRLRPTVSVALVIAFCATMSVWTVRNYRVHKRFVAVATNGGSTFYGGNNSIVACDFSHLGAWVPTTGLPGRELVEAAPDEVSHDKLEWSLGLNWIRYHAYLLPQLLTAKALRFILPDIDSPNSRYVYFTVLTGAPFTLLYIVGAIKTFRNRHYWTTPWLLIHSVFFTTWLIALIFWGSPRFRDSISPILMTYAAVPIGLRQSQPGCRRDRMMPSP